MRRDGGSVFPARANTGDPNGPLQGLSANEIACALISMVARSQRSNKRPDTLMQDRCRQLHKFSCNARPDHTFGSIVRFCHIFRRSDCAPIASRTATGKFSQLGRNPWRCRLCVQFRTIRAVREISLGANKRHMQRNILQTDFRKKARVDANS